MDANDFFKGVAEDLGSEKVQKIGDVLGITYRVCRVLIPLLFLIGMIFLTVLYIIRAEMLFFIITLWIGVIMFIAGISLSRFVQKWESAQRYTMKEEYDDEPNLYSFNGIGTRFIDVSGNNHVKYQFFCFLFMPLIPLGCYAAASSGEGYKWYGYAKWNIFEIFAIYMKWWGGLIACMSLIYSIVGLNV